MPDLAARAATIREKRAALARRSIDSFCRYVLTDDSTDAPFGDTLPLHRHWQALADEHPRLVLYKPSGTGASTQLVVGRTLYLLGNDPRARIVIVGKAEKNAGRHVNRIAHYIEHSERLADCWPMEKGMQWSGTSIALKREGVSDKDTNVRALAAGADYDGGPIDLLLLHDCLDGENTGTPKLRDGMWRWYSEQLARRLKPTGRVILIGSPMHTDDLSGRLLAAKEMGFVLERSPIRDDAGKSIIPEIWPEERIDREERTAKDKVEFSRRMMGRLQEKIDIPPLMEWIPIASPSLDSPFHMRPIIDAFEETERHPIRVIIAAPRQFTKSFTVMHGLVWLMQRSNKCHIYATHTQDLANTVSRRTQDLCRRLGLTVDGPLNHWRVGGSEIKFVGIGSAIVGNKADGLFVVDDAYRDRQQADNAAERDKVSEWYENAASPCIHPWASRVWLATRWHEDDQSGRFIKSGLCKCIGECECDKWRYISLPAIKEDGTSLWPEKRSLKYLTKLREDMSRDGSDREWQAQMMQNPRPKGTRIFEGGARPEYTELPKRLRIGIGADLAYTAKARSDHSCAVVVGEDEGYFYLIRVIRRQCRAPEFREDLAALRQQYPMAPMRWHASGTEIGTGDFLNLPDPMSALPDGIGIEVLPARGSKEARADASGFTTAWNKGRFLIPSLSPDNKELSQEDRESILWLIRIVISFTGAEGNPDDALDGASSSMSTLISGAGTPVRNAPAYGTPEWYAREEQRVIEGMVAKFAASEGAEDASDGWQHAGNDRTERIGAGEDY